MHQFVMTTDFDDFTRLEDQDAIGIANRTQTMGNHKAGASLHQPIKSFLNFLFGVGVHIAGGFVQNHHARILHHHAGDRQQLALSLTYSGC